MHPNNPHHKPYNFDSLQQIEPHLSEYVFENSFGNRTIDFSNSTAVYLLNKALLSSHYNISQWSIPENYLCPPIPGRIDYLLHIQELLATNIDKEASSVTGLDIGVGANCIYPLLGASHFNWKMVGVDIHEEAVKCATSNVLNNKLSEKIKIRHQKDHANIFLNVLEKNEYVDFTICNPPFYNSAEEALRSNLRKERNLHKLERKQGNFNFGGQANELWCNGGEALFIKRMVKQSASVKDQVGWFTTLVSKKEHISKISKQLDKLKATHQTISMSQGNKKSRILAWSFNN